MAYLKTILVIVGLSQFALGMQAISISVAPYDTDSVIICGIRG